MLTMDDLEKEKKITEWAQHLREIRKRNDAEEKKLLPLVEAKLCILPYPIVNAKMLLLVDKQALLLVDEEAKLQLSVDEQAKLKRPMILIEEEEAKLCIYPTMEDYDEDEKVIHPLLHIV